MMGVDQWMKCAEPGCERWTLGVGRCEVHLPRVILVCGPPASGKSFYVAEHRKPGDVVWDFDEVMKALCGDTRGEPVRAAVGIVVAMRHAFFRTVRDQASLRGTVWFTRQGSRRRNRNAGHHEGRMPSRRAAGRDRDFPLAIEKWFREYEPGAEGSR